MRRRRERRAASGPRQRRDDRGRAPGAPRKAAVILSGGGARGAYEVGVLRALLTGASPTTGHRPLRPSIYTGTSVGAYNAAIMASQAGVPPEQAVANLERLWLERVANLPLVCESGAFRLRLDVPSPTCFLDPVAYARSVAVDSAALSLGAVQQAWRFASTDLPFAGRLMEAIDVSTLIDPGPMRRLIRETIDLEGLARTEKGLAVTASNWDVGTPRIFGRREIVERAGLDAVLASVAIPGIFPPVTIEGQTYVDGGVLMNTPLRPAIKAGASDLHVIYLDPLVRDSDIGRDLGAGTFDALARTYAIITAARIQNDIRIALLINLGLVLAAQYESGSGRIRDKQEVLALGALQEIGRRVSLVDLKQLDIYTYRPPIDLGGSSSLLDFSKSKVQELIERGYQDAVAHRSEPLRWEDLERNASL